MLIIILVITNQDLLCIQSKVLNISNFSLSALLYVLPIYLYQNICGLYAIFIITWICMKTIFITLFLSTASFKLYNYF